MKTSSRGWNLIKTMINNDITWHQWQNLVGILHLNPGRPLCCTVWAKTRGIARQSWSLKNHRVSLFLMYGLKAAPSEPCTCLKFLYVLLLQSSHLVALGGIPVFHLLDPVVRLDGGELVGVALPGVHRVHGQVLLQRRVLLEEEGKVREGRRFLGQLCSVEQRLVVPFDETFFNWLFKVWKFGFSFFGVVFLPPHKLPHVPCQPGFVPQPPNQIIHSSLLLPVPVPNLQDTCEYFLYICRWDIVFAEELTIMEDLGLDGEEKMLGPTDQLLYMAPESKSELYYYLKQFWRRWHWEWDVWLHQRKCQNKI